MRTTLILTGLAIGLMTTQAKAISTGTYQLHNHPDGSLSLPGYGLRLDGLLTGDSEEEYTFDFDHVSSDMTLTWNGASIIIQGQAFGGEDIGASYGAGTTALWDIYFEYDVGVSQAADGGVDDIRVDADNVNFGTVSSVLGSFELEDQWDNTGLSFRLGDLDGTGHRGFAGISGWGWMNHGVDCVNSNCTHNYASDWLFTMDPVPVPIPAAIWLFATGLTPLLMLARRKSH